MTGNKPLKNARQEVFAQNVAKGMSYAAAYVEAGYVNQPQNAARLGNKPHVRARTDYIKSKAAERAVTTVEDIARQLDADREFARINKSSSAAVQATMGKAKVLGLIVDKHVLGLKKIEDMNENELRSLLGQLGVGDDGNAESG